MFIEIVATSPHGTVERTICENPGEARRVAFLRSKGGWLVDWRWVGAFHDYNPDDDNSIPESI